VTPDTRFPAAHFLNRELSWLEFNGRVLAEAFDERNRLLERLKFISIFSTNLDEFYMVRVAGLRRQVSARVQQTPADGMTARDQLDRIELRVREMLQHAHRCLHDQLLPDLQSHGVRLLSMAELTADVRESDLSRADTARGRSGASVSVHLQSLDLTRRRAP
jgi:polyphosphate kinase